MRALTKHAHFVCISVQLLSLMSSFSKTFMNHKRNLMNMIAFPLNQRKTFHSYAIVDTFGKYSIKICL